MRLTSKAANVRESRNWNGSRRGARSGSWSRSWSGSRSWSVSGSRSGSCSWSSRGGIYRNSDSRAR